MGRLQISLWCFACLLITAPPAFTQQTSTAGNAEITFVVAGDVARPHEYSVDDARFSLRQALMHAGMISEGVNVLVIRNLEGNGQWSHFISRSGTDSGPEIRNGDVLVAYSSGRVDGPIIPNSVFVNGQYAFVIGLDSQVNTGVMAGQVLEKLGESPAAVRTLQIMSGKPGRARRSVTLSQEIQHGDVLVLRSDGRPSGSPQSGFSPQVSEWREPEVGSSDSSVAVSANADAASVNDFAVPLMNSGAHQLAIPAVPQALEGGNSTWPSEGNQQSASFVLPSLSDSVGDDRATSNAFSEVEPPATDVNPVEADVLPVAVPFSVEPDQLRMASLKQAPPDSNVGSTAAKTVSVSDPSASALPAAGGEPAPVPPTELQEPVEIAAYNAWNTVFVVGLMLAGVLIVGGWLKSEAEMRQMQMISAVEAIAPSPSVAAGLASSPLAAKNADLSAGVTLVNESSDVKEATVAISEIDSFNAARVPGDNLTGDNLLGQEEQAAPATQAGPAVVNAVQPLVKSTEWFAADWIPAVVVNSDQATVGGGQPVTSEAHVAIDRWSEQNQKTSSETCEEHLQQLATAENQSATQPVVLSNGGMESPVDDAVAQADRATLLSQSAAMLSNSEAEDVACDQNGEVAAGRASGFEELTDLIENRLPVDLCEARLPLRISLFGAPAGPKRLRIDAAHKQLAGPHMPLTSERRRPGSVTAAATTVAGGQASQVAGQPVMAEGASLADSKSTGAVEVDAPVPDRAAGSLDRALNFLNEQGN